MERDLESLYKKVDNIEYVEIKEIKEDIGNMKIDLAKNNLLTQQNIESSKELSATMNTIKDAMVTMSDSIKQSNIVSEKLSENVKELGGHINDIEQGFNGRIKDINDKVIEIDNKSKIDIVEVQKDSVKSNIGKYIMTGGISAGVGALILKIIELLIK